MLDLVKNFSKFEKQITRYCMDRKRTYFNSSGYERLKNRFNRLDAANNMQFPNNWSRGSTVAYNRFMSKIALPLVKEKALFRRAITLSAFSQDNLIMVDPAGGTPFFNATNMQDLLNLNMHATQYRRRAHRPVVNWGSRVGSAILYHEYHETQQSFPKTVQTGIGTQRVTQTSVKKNVVASPIHPLRYLQNIQSINPWESDYQGHLNRWHLSNLIHRTREAEEVYIKKNVDKVIKEAKQSARKDTVYYQDDGEMDFNKFLVDITHLFIQIHIEGNEDDMTYYYVEMTDDTILRIQDNPFDENMRPYSVFNFDKRVDYWWGNVDAEFVQPHENYINLLLSMTADNALKSMERYIFYDKGSLDTQDINDRHINNGFIGVDGRGKRIDQLLYEHQGKDISLQGSDFILREVKENMARLSSKPDLQRPPSSGGPQNKTAFAANLLDAQGNTLESDYMDSWAQGYEDSGKIQMIIMQQFLGDQIALRPDVRQDERVVEKSEILGDMVAKVQSSLTKNKAGEAQRLMEAITAIINFKGTGLPEFEKMNIVPIVRKWVEKVDVGDVDIVYPEEAQFDQVPGQLPLQQIPNQPAGQQVPALA